MPPSPSKTPRKPSPQARLREAERQLREQQEQALALLQSMGQFTFVASAEGVLRDPTLWCAFTGQAPNAAQGQGWLDAVLADDRATILPGVAQITAGSGPFEAECRIRRHDGVYRHCLLRIVPMMGADGDPREWLGICADITERLHQHPWLGRPVEQARALASQLAAALEAMTGSQLSHEASTDVKLIALLRERAQLTHEHDQARIEALALSAANRQMDEFLAVAAHDLLTPIATSTGYVQLALRRLGELAPRPADHPDNYLIAAMRHSLARADQGLGHLSRLAARLLDVGRIESRKLQFALGNGDLAMIVREVVEDLQQIMPERTIRLEISAEQRIPVVVDADRIAEVVTNFLTNAQRYSPSERPIAVTVAVEPGVARVAVRDEGRGIPASQQKRIWRRFEQARLKEQQNKQGAGLGLGLYIAKSIVEGHHGHVGVTSRIGHGATFWFTLPIIADQQ
ncbi:MAG TPA: PAS domain-containing sensor histidine kinase [Ktedonobacterales bacterium]